MTENVLNNPTFPHDLTKEVFDGMITIRESEKLFENMRELQKIIINDIQEFTVASEDTPEEERKECDFDNFTEAIHFVLRNMYLSSGHTVLILKSGQHYIEDDIGRHDVGAIDISTYQFNHGHLSLLSESGHPDDVIISLGDIERINTTLFRIETGRLNLNNITFDMSKSKIPYPGHYIILFRYSSSYSYIYNVKFIGWDKSDMFLPFFLDPASSIAMSYILFKDLKYGIYLIRDAACVAYRAKAENVENIIIGNYLSRSFLNISEEINVDSRARIGDYILGSYKLTTTNESFISPSGGKIIFDDKPYIVYNESKGEESERPTPNQGESIGFYYWNKTTRRPNFWTGEKWVETAVVDA